MRTMFILTTALAASIFYAADAATTAGGASPGPARELTNDELRDRARKQLEAQGKGAEADAMLADAGDDREKLRELAGLDREPARESVRGTSTVTADEPNKPAPAREKHRLVVILETGEDPEKDLRDFVQLLEGQGSRVLSATIQSPRRQDRDLLRSAESAPRPASNMNASGTLVTGQAAVAGKTADVQAPAGIVTSPGISAEARSRGPGDIPAATTGGSSAPLPAGAESGAGFAAGQGPTAADTAKAPGTGTIASQGPGAGAGDQTGAAASQPSGTEGQPAGDQNRAASEETQGPKNPADTDRDPTPRNPGDGQK